MDGSHLITGPVRAGHAPDDLAEREPVSRLVTPDDMLTAALWWAARGLHVFPCEIGGKRPVTVHGFQDAVAEPDRIRSWWQGRAYNIGVATGYPGPDVLDVDVRADGDGWAAFGRLKAAGLLAGAHLLVRTPSGGAHLHFAGTAQRCSSIRAEHLDFKASGGYVILPPSQVGGRRYELADQRAPTGAALDWPACARLLSPARRPLVSANQARSRSSGSVAHLPGWMAGQTTGNRNRALYWAACRAAEVGNQDVLRQLVDAGMAAGLDQAEAWRTVVSAARRINGD